MCSENKAESEPVPAKAEDEKKKKKPYGHIYRKNHTYEQNRGHHIT